MDQADEPPPPPRRVRDLLGELPPALLAGLVLGFVLGSAITLYRAHLIGDQAWRGLAWVRLLVLGDALAFVVAVAMAIGFGQLRARTSGIDRTLLTVAVVALVVAVARSPVNAYFTYYDPPRGRWIIDFYLWQSRLGFGLWLVAGGCLAAALARHGRVGLALGGLALVGVVLEHPLRTLAELWYFDDRAGHPWANAAIDIGLTAVHVVSLSAAAWWLGRGAPPPARAGALADGLVRIEAALIARVVIAVAAALLTMMAIGARSLFLMKLVVIVVPLAVLLSQVAMVAGLFRAASAADGPRVRLTWAAVLTVLTGFAGWCQAVAAYAVARARWGRHDTWRLDELERYTQVWPYALPAVAVLALLLLLWAVDDVRRSTPSSDPPAPLAAGVWAVIGTASALVLPHLLRGRRVTAGDLMLIALFVAVANVVATLVVARQCGKAAAALRAAGR